MPWILLQIWRMSCDIIVLLIAAYLVIEEHAILMPLLMLFLWFNEEPLEAWRPSNIRRVLNRR